jgi:hypothetical protein
MSNYIGITVGTPSTNVVLNLNDATARVANLMRRNDLNNEIAQWLNFVLREITDKVDFPELRTTLNPFSLIPYDPSSMTTSAQAAQSYVYPLPLVTNFSHAGSIYYEDTTLLPTRGWNLQPLPREFFRGDTVDFERVLHRGNPGVGDPIYYFIDRTGNMNVNSTYTTAGELCVLIYPAFIVPKTGTLTLTYYKTPSDWTSPAQTPDLDARWRHYLIYLAYYWGMMFMEKDNIQMLSFYRAQYKDLLGVVRQAVLKTENRTHRIDKPTIGMDFADMKYGR